MKTETIIAIYFVWLAGLTGYTLGARHLPSDWYQAIPALPLLAIPILYGLSWILRRLHP